MGPQIVCNGTALLVAVVASFIFGFLWYGPLFGNAWANELGFKIPDPKPGFKEMRVSLLLQVIGVVLTSYVMIYSLNVWRPSVWGITTGDGAPAMYNFMAGMWNWIGFYLPGQLSRKGWEGRSWKFFTINTVYDFLNLQLIAQIIAHL